MVVSKEETMKSVTEIVTKNDCTVSLETNPSSNVSVVLTSPLRIGVLGTGNFGRAIVTKLRSAGVHVVWGSRSPDSGSGQIPAEKVMMESMIVLAVPVFSWNQEPMEKMLSSLEPGTVLIDCSNRTKWCKQDQMSQAEQLQLLTPDGVNVVKCFNTLSAYELENQIVTGKQIPIAGNCSQSKHHVSALLEKLGYHVTDLGVLENSRSIENIPLSLFLSWRWPLLVSTCLWFFLFLMTFGRYHFCAQNKLGWYPEEMYKMPTKYINKTCDNHALIMLAICYLPGNFAAYLQLLRGTKYSQFPEMLDSWLKMRKQLGILMLLSASIHGCYYCLMYTGTRHEGWQSQIYLGAGVIAYFTAVILGITSLPSVSTSLTWREFRMIQSKLGWFCLLLATVHCMANGWQKLDKFHQCFFFEGEQVAVVVPLITIALKIPLLLPCIDNRLTNIRQGKVY